MRILYLTHRLPYAPNRGDRIRSHYMLREMSRWAKVSLFSLVHDDEEAAQSAHVSFARSVVTSRVPRVGNYVRGILRLASSQPLTHVLLDAPDVKEKLAAMVEAESPDVVLAHCSGMARFAMEPPLDALPLVLDMVDVDSVKWRQLAARVAWPRSLLYAREARTLSCFEAAASARARTVLVVNERERDVLLGLAPHADVRVVPMGIELCQQRADEAPSAEPVVVFCGMMDYEPNIDAVCWFAERVWPQVRARRPDARFVIVGANAAPAVRALASPARSIEVTGRVDAVEPYLRRAAVSVAPVRMARGVQTKVLEALAAGLPVVMTKAVRDGLPAGVEKGCVVADDPEAFAGSVIDVLSLAPDARRTMALESRVDRLGWSQQLAGLSGILEAAARGETCPSTASRTTRVG